MKSADLHIHTFFSDSTDSPEQVVAKLVKAELACCAITDHDTIEGVEPVRQAALGTGVEVIPGVELSTTWEGKDIHVLGYGMNENSSELKEYLSRFRQARRERMRAMVDRLKPLGIDNVSLEEVEEHAGAAHALGRPHLAQILVQKGWVASLREAFVRFLAEDAPAFVPKFQQTPQEAVSLIRRCGGVSVLAHPMLTQKDEIIPALVEAGLQGIEVFYPQTTDRIREYYLGLAKKHRLLVTGGSDAHGAAKKHTDIGAVRLPYSYVEELKAVLSDLSGNA